MEGKLIKLGLSEGYRLDDLNGNYIASTLNGKNKLSLKNCEAISNGYDLEGLACDRIGIDISVVKHIDRKVIEKNESTTTPIHEAGALGASLYHTVKGFEIGFQKAIELLGDKKFTYNDVQRAFIQGAYTKTEIHRKKEEYMQSLQQTEWDVEICCQNDCYGDYTTCKKSSFECQICTNTGIPKLDEDGCLILRRK